MHAWIGIGGGRDLSCKVFGDEAEFTSDSDGWSVCLAATEDGLDRLVEVANEALARMRAVPPGEEYCATVESTTHAANQ